MSENSEKLVDSFVQGLGVTPQQVSDDLAYQAISEWDSTGHMALVAELEACFDVMLDTDEIIDMSSVSKARQILEKHGVAF